jgi:hypothetical protein
MIKTLESVRTLMRRSPPLVSRASSIAISWSSAFGAPQLTTKIPQSLVREALASPSGTTLELGNAKWDEFAMPEPPGRVHPPRTSEATTTERTRFMMVLGDS